MCHFPHENLESVDAVVEMAIDLNQGKVLVSSCNANDLIDGAILFEHFEVVCSNLVLCSPWQDVSELSDDVLMVFTVHQHI